MRLGRRILVFVMAFALVVPFVVGQESEAATKSFVMLKGESKTLKPGIGSLKSVKSSKKSVASVKKNGKTCIVTAKKAGSATITVKTKKKSVKYKVSVKALKFDKEVVSIAITQGYYGTISKVAVKVTNRTGLYIDSAFLTCKMIDENGDVVSSNRENLSYLVSGRDVYRVYEYTGATKVVSATVDVNQPMRNTGTKYTDQSKNVSVALGYVSEIGRVYTITNNTDRTVLGTVDMVSYDTNGNVIYVNPMPIYLIAGASTEVKVPGLSAEMVSFEEIVRACSTT